MGFSSFLKAEYYFIVCIYCVLTQSCPTLCSPMDCSPPGSSVLLNHRELTYGYQGGRVEGESRGSLGLTCIHRCMYKDNLGEGDGNPLQCSCSVNPMDRGAWRATVHEVTRSRTLLSNQHEHFHTQDGFSSSNLLLGNCALCKNKDYCLRNNK